MLCTTLLCWLVSLVSFFLFQSCYLVPRFPPTSSPGSSFSEETVLAQPRNTAAATEEQKGEGKRSKRAHEIGAGVTHDPGVIVVWPRAVLPLNLGVGLILSYCVAAFTLPSLFSYLYFTTSTALLLLISFRSGVPLALRIVERMRIWMVAMAAVLSAHILLLYLIQTQYLAQHFPSRAALLLNLQAYEEDYTALLYSDSNDLPSQMTFAIILEFLALFVLVRLHRHFCQHHFSPPPIMSPGSLMPRASRSRGFNRFKTLQSAETGAESKQVAADTEAIATGTGGNKSAEGTGVFLAGATGAAPRPLTSPAVLTRKTSAYPPSGLGGGYPQHGSAESSIPFR